MPVRGSEAHRASKHQNFAVFERRGRKRGRAAEQLGLASLVHSLHFCAAIDQSRVGLTIFPNLEFVPFTGVTRKLSRLDWM
jgi:hypothetical protein